MYQHYDASSSACAHTFPATVLILSSPLPPPLCTSCPQPMRTPAPVPRTAAPPAGVEMDTARPGWVSAFLCLGEDRVCSSLLRVKAVNT